MCVSKWNKSSVRGSRRRPSSRSFIRWRIPARKESLLPFSLFPFSGPNSSYRADRPRGPWDRFITLTRRARYHLAFAHSSLLFPHYTLLRCPAFISPSPSSSSSPSIRVPTSRQLIYLCAIYFLCLGVSFSQSRWNILNICIPISIFSIIYRNKYIHTHFVFKMGPIPVYVEKFYAQKKRLTLTNHILILRFVLKLKKIFFLIQENFFFN